MKESTKATCNGRNVFLQISHAHCLFRPIVLKCLVILTLVFRFCYFLSMFSLLTPYSFLCNGTRILCTWHPNLIRTLVFVNFFHCAIVVYIWSTIMQVGNL